MSESLACDEHTRAGPVCGRRAAYIVDFGPALVHGRAKCTRHLGTSLARMAQISTSPPSGSPDRVGVLSVMAAPAPGGNAP